MCLLHSIFFLSSCVLRLYWGLRLTNWCQPHDSCRQWSRWSHHACQISSPILVAFDFCHTGIGSNNLGLAWWQMTKQFGFAWWTAIWWDCGRAKWHTLKWNWLKESSRGCHHRWHYQIGHQSMHFQRQYALAITQGRRSGKIVCIFVKVEGEMAECLKCITHIWVESNPIVCSTQRVESEIVEVRSKEIQVQWDVRSCACGHPINGTHKALVYLCQSFFIFVMFWSRWYGIIGEPGIIGVMFGTGFILSTQKCWALSLVKADWQSCTYK